MINQGRASVAITPSAKDRTYVVYCVRVQEEEKLPKYYIGATTRDFYGRISSHISSATTIKNPKSFYPDVLSFISNSSKISIKFGILESCSNETLSSCEEKWIQCAKTLDKKLYNVKKGGNGILNTKKWAPQATPSKSHQKKTTFILKTPQEGQELPFESLLTKRKKITVSSYEKTAKKIENCVYRIKEKLPPCSCTTECLCPKVKRYYGSTWNTAGNRLALHLTRVRKMGTNPQAHPKEGELSTLYQNISNDPTRFSFGIVCVPEDPISLRKWEQAYIHVQDTKNTEKGYNKRDACSTLEEESHAVVKRLFE